MQELTPVGSELKLMPAGLHGMLVHADDYSTYEAEAFADMVLRGQVPLDIPLDALDTAFVDRFEGMVIFSTLHARRADCAGKRVGLRFRTTIAGYDGSGPLSSATILSKFRFGPKLVLLEQLNHGGDTARILVTKMMNELQQ